jgi:anti-sigma-K factor RskA
MNPDAHEIHALSGAYAVDALDPAERAQFEAHLASCAACQAEVASLQEATTLLGGLDEAPPPTGLRDRVLAGIQTVRPLPPLPSQEPENPAEEQGEEPAAATVRALPVRRWLTGLAVAASVLGITGVGAVVWEQQHQSTSQLSVADRVLQAADAKRVTVNLPGGVSASVIRSVSEGRAVLVTHNMPAAPNGRVYELWLQSPAGKMVPAGLMDTPGNRPVVLRGDATNATAVGITVEPEGGSDSPTSDPIALFDLERAT